MATGVESIISELGGESPQTRAIAEGLVNNGISSLKDIGVKQTTRWEQRGDSGSGDAPGLTYWVEVPENKFYNKTTNQAINPLKIAMIGNETAGVSGGDLFFNLDVNNSGNLSFSPQFSPRSGGFVKEYAPVLAIAAMAVPGVGEAVGYAILGGGDVIAGAALAGEIATSVGISTVTAASVASATGAAAISAGSTAAAGGTVEDVIKAGVAAGATVGVNFAAGGGITGAAAGSAVGTAIQGGNFSQVATNALAAGVGAGVQGAMPDNPNAGKIIGAAARTYISSGGNLDQTLLNTAATAIGTLDKKTSAPVDSTTSGKQVDANTIIGPSVAGAGDQMASTLAGMMSTQKPEISNVNDFKTFVNEEVLKSQFSPVAGPAVGASAVSAIPLAQQSVFPSAMRFVANNPALAAEAIGYLNQVGLWGVAGAAASLFLIPSDTKDLSIEEIRNLMQPVSQPELKTSVENILKVDPLGVQSTAGAGRGSVNPPFVTPAEPSATSSKPATTTTKVTDTGDEKARLLARFPAPGAAPISDLSVIGGAEGDPIYTQLSASINSGIDPYIAIAQMAEGARLYREDPAPYLERLMDAAAVQGLNPQKTVDAAVPSDVVTEPQTGSGEKIIPGAVPGTIPGAISGDAAGVMPGVIPGTIPGVVPGTIPGTIPGSITGTIPKVLTGDITLDGTNNPLGNVAVVGGGDNVTGNVAVVGGGSNNAGNVVVDGGGGNLAGNVVIDDGGGNLSANVSANVVVTGGGVDDTGKDTSVDTGGDDTKSTTVQEPPTPIYPTVTQVPRPRKPVPTTITGPSPARLLADALSAYRPAGAIEGVESGKEREPVWNTESLRNALGI